MFVLQTAFAQKYNIFYKPKDATDRNAFRNKDSYEVVQVNNKFSIRTAEPVVQINYEQTINKTGWATLSLSTNSDYSDEQQAFAAGFAEGMLMR